MSGNEDLGDRSGFDGAGRAAEAIREMLHARYDHPAADMHDLYHLVGDLARLAHAAAEATEILTGRLADLHRDGRLHHDETRRRLPALTLDDINSTLQQAQRALRDGGGRFDDAHNDISHLYVAGPQLRVVPDANDDEVGEEW